MEPVNSCIGLAQTLATRGHHITFITVEAFTGYFDKFGFDEIVLPTVKTKDSVKCMSEELLASGLLLNKSPLEKALMWTASGPASKTLEEKYNQALEYHHHLDRIINVDKPDVIVLDHYFVLPCVLHSAIPWVAVTSASSLCVFDSPNLPPFLSGKFGNIFLFAN